MGSFVSRANRDFCPTVLRLSDSVVTNTAHCYLRDIIYVYYIFNENPRKPRKKWCVSPVPAWLHETVADGDGDLDTVVETALIEQLGPGHGALHKDAVAARMEIMRDELAPYGLSPLEVLLAE